VLKWCVNAVIAVVRTVVRVVRSTVEILRETVLELVSPECVSDPAQEPERPGTPVAPKRATGARVSFAIAYLAILAALRLWGFDGPFVIAAMVEDLIVNCRPLRSLLAR
jgi:hypothetical protein